MIQGRARIYFYRTHAGAEVDLLLVFRSGDRWALETQRCTQPRPTWGFHVACQDLRAERQLIVHPGHERFRLDRKTEAMGLADLLEALR